MTLRSRGPEPRASANSATSACGWALLLAGEAVFGKGSQHTEAPADGERGVAQPEGHEITREARSDGERGTLGTGEIAFGLARDEHGGRQVVANEQRGASGAQA